MQVRLLLSVALCGLLTGCEAKSQPLPESEKLSAEKVRGIAERIETNYPDLSRDLREQILATVVRSLDDMVFIEGGEFEMGDFGTLCEYDPANMGTWPYGQEPERLCPITRFNNDDYLHHVRLSSYHLSRYQTRLEDFDLFRTSLGFELFDAELRKRENLQELFHPDKPAWTKHWQEAKNYCLWLGELSSHPVDLPTEAQWEYAARNRGLYVQYPTDNGSLDYGRNIAADEVTDELPIAQFTPTPLGLYDMAGNATDWVNDWYAENYYRVSPEENPTGPATGTQRVRRGSNYQESMWMSANTVRRWNDEPERSRHLPGTSFRCSIQSDTPL